MIERARLACAPAERLGLSAARRDAGLLGRLPGVAQAARAGARRRCCSEIRAHNPLLFDFVLKRAAALERQSARRGRVRDARVFHEMISACRATPSACSSASPPSASRTARRSAAWSTAARPGWRCRDADIQPRPRPPQARHLAPRHAAPRGRRGRDPLRRVRRPDHRHADRAADPQHGPAQQGLRGDRRQVPPRPRRLHLLAEVRHPRSARRRPRLGARDRGARRRRRDRARSGCASSYGVAVRGYLAQLGDDRDPVRALGATVDDNPFFAPDAEHRAAARELHGRAAQVRRLVRRAHQRGRRRRAGRAGASRSTTSSTPTSPTR